MLLPAHTQDALPQPSLSNQSFVLVPCKLVGTGAHGHQYLHHSQLETSVDVFLSLQYLPSWLVISQAAKTPLMFPQGFAALAWAPVSVFFFFYVWHLSSQGTRGISFSAVVVEDQLPRTGHFISGSQIPFLEEEGAGQRGPHMSQKAGPWKPPGQGFVRRLKSKGHQVLPGGCLERVFWV